MQAFSFDRDNVGLKGFYNFFKKNSDEEREHAEKLMKYQNMRGGRILLQDIKVWFSHDDIGKMETFVHFFLPMHTYIQGIFGDHVITIWAKDLT